MRRTYSNRVSSFSQHRLAIGKEREGERENIIRWRNIFRRFAIEQRAVSSETRGARRL